MYVAVKGGERPFPPPMNSSAGKGGATPPSPIWGSNS